MIAAVLHAPDEWRTALSTLLTDAGVTTIVGDAPTDVPVVGVWLGSPLASSTDTWVRASRPHLVVSLTSTHVQIGPFVDPGLTACLHCLEAAAAATAPGEARVPPPGMLMVAAGWIAHDVRRWHEGREPTTWSASVLVDARLEVSRHRWLRHPHCGCAWGLTA